jgi:hypothetical protein
MKDLWTGKAPLGMALLHVFVIGVVLWVIVGLVGVELVGRADGTGPQLALMALRAAIVVFATIVIFRCSRNASPTARRQARAVMLLVLVLYAAMLAASLPVLLARF